MIILVFMIKSDDKLKLKLNVYISDDYLEIFKYEGYL